MGTIFKNRNIQCGTKVKVFKACVWSDLMYRSECWTFTKEMEKRFLADKMSFIRKIFRISRTQKKTKESAGTDRSLLRLIRKRQMQFFCQINIHDGLEKLILHGKVKRKTRSRSTTTQSFMDSLSRLINISKKTLSKLGIFRRTEDREAWKSLIVDVCA
ncbi:hypothetical protein ElyMa_004552600 [Elysia marginata]|uniref:Uncharacterized protein n=1 Tax=Elysia marginata TaxID=1093978 RepID=A0AAV4HS00_9GAST|nr:hypothetical protein ElyMa_004552600 [Elysia marginata]